MKLKFFLYLRAKTKVNLKPELKKMKVVRNAYESLWWNEAGDENHHKNVILKLPKATLY